MRWNNHHHGAVRRSLLAGLTVVIALIFGFTATALAWPGAGHPPSRAEGTKPTIVLEHGAWADSSGWNGVINNLQHHGYTVIAPANPLRGLPTDSAYLASILKTISGPIVLVGHSYGGAVITNAAVGNPNVKALVYIAAFTPDQGESLGGLEMLNPGSELTPANLMFRSYQLASGAQGTDVYINPRVFNDAFAGDLSTNTAAVMAAEQRPLDLSALTDPSGPPAWKTIPSWYLVAKDDHTIPHATEEFMAKRANAHTVVIDSSHVAMISHPDAVAHLILDAANSTS